MKTCDKILLGIVNHWPRINETISFETAELAWIIYHDLDGWRIENGWKKIEYSAEKGPNENSYLDKPFRDRAKVAKELSILQANEFLEFDRYPAFDMHFDVRILPKGFLRAENLSTCKGIIELWYSENKNGILGIAMTILLSIITSWITSRIILKGG